MRALIRTVWRIVTTVLVAVCFLTVAEPQTELVKGSTPWIFLGYLILGCFASVSDEREKP